MIFNDTICAISSGYNQSAISLIRISGEDALKICDKIFKRKSNKKITSKEKSKLLFGEIIIDNMIIDEVLVSIFVKPYSYTGENIVEISCHGSIYIQDTIIQGLIKNGCRLAKKGEFTLRAFLNKKIDLSQAEGVAELISSENAESHKLAMQQMRGGFSNEIQVLRNKFVKFASLIELELDFSQEDVEFADRSKLVKIIDKIKKKVISLLDSFKYGNVLKNGTPISIVGHPNSGKSTLLNTILNEDRAIVSNTKGTTRDTIEEDVIIQGHKFKFIDTAGLRKTKNKIEKKGIEKTLKKIDSSAIVIYLIDKENFQKQEVLNDIKKIKFKLKKPAELILVANKNDLNNSNIKLDLEEPNKIIHISAKNRNTINELLDEITKKIDLWKALNQTSIIINQRHFDTLTKIIQSIEEIEKGLAINISGELLVLDIKRCLDLLGEITGEITNEDLLDSIFRDFCIGK